MSISKVTMSNFGNMKDKARAFPLKPEFATTPSQNQHLETNPVPAKNAYIWNQLGSKISQRSKRVSFVESKSMLGGHYDNVVIPSGSSISHKIMNEQIRRGTQAGFKTTLNGPVNRQVTSTVPSMNSFGSIGSDFDGTTLGHGVDPRLFNIVGSSWRAGQQTTVNPKDVSGFEKIGLHNRFVKTENKLLPARRAGLWKSGFNAIREEAKALS